MEVDRLKGYTAKVGLRPPRKKPTLGLFQVMVDEYASNFAAALDRVSSTRYKLFEWPAGDSYYHADGRVKSIPLAFKCDNYIDGDGELWTRLR